MDLGRYARNLSPPRLSLLGDRDNARSRYADRRGGGERETDVVGARRARRGGDLDLLTDGDGRRPRDLERSSRRL